MAATVAHAQELRYQFKNYTPSDGLPSSETYQVLRDASNYMWFATDHGVTRYNGYGFETFNLPDNSIMGLYEDWKKRVWAYTFSGRLFYYENGKFYAYKWNDKLVDAVKPGIIQIIHVDSSDMVHASSSGPYYITVTDRGELSRQVEINPVAKFAAFESGKSDFFVRVVTFPEKFQGIRITIHDSISEFDISIGKEKMFIRLPKLIQHERTRLKKLSDGRLILYTKEGYCLIGSKEKYHFIPTSYTIDDVEEVDGNCFLATDKGVVIVNYEGDIIEKYLDGVHITSIEKDYEGGLWLTSHTNGVYYLNYFKIKHLSKDAKIIDKRFNIVYKLSDTSILAGTQGGEMVRFKQPFFFQEKQLNLKNIVSFHEVRPGFILVGGSIGWFDSRMWQSYFVPQPKPVTYFQIPNNSNFIVKDSVLYSGMASAVFEYKHEEFRIPSNYYIEKESFRTSKLFLEKNGNILIGNHFGLWRYTNSSLKPYDSTKKLLNSRITDIAYYNNKFLCLSTRGNGMLLLVNDSIHQLKQENGLVSDNLRRIFVDKDDIWLASNNGISIVTIHSLQPFRYSIRNITVQDGLLSNEINSIIKQGDNIIVASNHGVSFLSKKAVMLKRIATLPLHIKEIRLGALLVNSQELTKLGYRKRTLNISYEALNYSSAGKNNYRYRLNGYDSTWIYTNNHEIQFNPLPYGEYTLEIQAKREFDQWGQSTSIVKLPVVCKAPFWATAWFWVLISAVVLILLLLVFRNRIQLLKQRQREREALQERIGASEQMALKAQMNPHFIFNSLNSIQQYVIESDVKGANEFISGFSRLIRQTLEFSSKEYISLQEEISYLTTYLDLEKARMESKFEYTVQVETLQPASQLELPPLLLQPYVENALRHGIKYRKDADGLIQLFFIEYPGILECIIEDNGIGRKRAMELKAVNPIEYQSRGMALTAERVLLLNEQREQKIEIVIEDLMNADGSAAGTRIRVRFPIE
ncbi:MAG: hypothetical protein GXC73_12110 [Chitinophagaceae bacterium]|nr:hypothetical protein [Chitinophagaceae bacterium]